MQDAILDGIQNQFANATGGWHSTIFPGTVRDCSVYVPAQYDPKTPGEWIRNVCCGIVNRGIAAYNGDRDGWTRAMNNVLAAKGDNPYFLWIAGGR